MRNDTKMPRDKPLAITFHFYVRVALDNYVSVDTKFFPSVSGKNANDHV